MYATLGHALPRERGWTFEPKYDGMRVLAEVTPRGGRLVTRNGRDKSRQFPEIILALRLLAQRLGRSLLLDGEIIARRRRRRPADAPARSDFQQLQSRMHLTNGDEIVRLAVEAPTTLVVFDLLRDGRTATASRPWADRRERLEQLFDDAGDATGPGVIVGETNARGGAMLARARRAGWEGLIAKRTDAPYRPGVRSGDWLKLKLLFRAEFVVGGYTDPRNARQHLGALLLGAYDAEGAFVYVGHTGGGFSHASLARMHQRLERITRRTCPFSAVPKTNQRAHWVSPRLVVEVKFAEWTAGRLLRQPIFLGVRDDKRPGDVTIEAVSLQRWGTGEIANDAA